jgi:hypothetical protein
LNALKTERDGLKVDSEAAKTSLDGAETGEAEKQAVYDREKINMEETAANRDV